MIKLDDAKAMFRDDVDAYGKPKKIMAKLTAIYDSIGSCSECEHWNRRYKKENICFMHDIMKKPNGYCDDFERKED